MQDISLPRHVYIMYNFRSSNGRARVAGFDKCITRFKAWGVSLLLSRTELYSHADISVVVRMVLVRTGMIDCGCLLAKNIIYQCNRTPTMPSNGVVELQVLARVGVLIRKENKQLKR